MAEDGDRKRIIDRANRMVRQSQILRKMSEELLHESQDIRRSVPRKPRNPSRKKR